MKNLLISFKITLFFTVVCGWVYPLLITGFAQVFFRDKASGQMISHQGQIMGSLLIAQKFEKPEYFWPRPSAVDYNPLPSGGSNLGPTAQALKEAMEVRKKKWQEHAPGQVIPQDLLFASASGLDPHISPSAAQAQVARVAKARSLDEASLHKLIEEQTQDRDAGLLGEATVNVLALNIALDKISDH